jgi:hypothetical protein
MNHSQSLLQDRGIRDKLFIGQAIGLREGQGGYALSAPVGNLIL